jgi:4-amino-4-deoxy-L-arabinose transferase-like glycosyltransferase
MAAARGVRRLFLPTLDGAPYREKPAGYYWLVALAYAACGVGERAARMPSALAALVTVLALYAATVRRAGPPGAFAAGIVAATSAGWLGLARYGNLDMTLTACATVGVLAGVAWLDRPPPCRPPLAPYVVAGAGMLVKGPIAVVLVAGPLLIAAAVRRKRPTLAELGLVRGIAVMAAVAAALYGPVAVLDRSYLVAFAGTNLRRWSADSPHAAGVWYYLVWVPVLFLPWTPFALGALRRAWRDPARRALVLWAAFVPAFLTLPRGKLATYALPALAPLALVVGPELARAVLDGVRDDDRVAFRIGALLIAAFLAAAAVAVGIRVYPIPLGARVAGAAVTAAWAAILVSLVRRDRLTAVPVAVLGVVLTVFPLAVRTVAPAVAALHSERDVAAAIARAGAGPVIAFGIRDPSLGFYLRAPVLYTSDPAIVRDAFATAGPAFLVTSTRHVAEIEAALGAGAYVWWTTPRRRLYANRPPPAALQERNGSSQRAREPSSSAIARSRLYFAVRSARHGAPVLICPAAVATAKSAMNGSSVSPERCETTFR